MSQQPLSFTEAVAAARVGSAIFLGSNTASASPSTTTAATDLISAATNTNGITITSISLSGICAAGSGSGGTVNVTLLINGTVMLNADGGTNSNVSARGTANQCSLGALKVPAGQAVSYSFTLGNASGSGTIIVTWKPN